MRVVRCSIILVFSASLFCDCSNKNIKNEDFIYKALDLKENDIVF